MKIPKWFGGRKIDNSVFKSIVIPKEKRTKANMNLLSVLMGFTSYDDLISEMTAGKRLVLPFSKPATTAPVASNWYHMWPVGGYPGAGVAYTGTALNHQRTTDLTTGALYHGGNKSTDTKHLVYQMLMSNAAEPKLAMLVDMVGYYPCVQSASLQTFVNTLGPDRYVSAGESGLQATLVCGGTTLMGATASNITALNYVDQDGNAGAMPTTPTVPITVSAAIHTATLGARVITTTSGPYIPLQAGDCGIRSLTNFTCSAANTGSMAFVMHKPLAFCGFGGASVPVERDLAMQLASLERVFDGACLTWFVWVSAATAFTMNGDLEVAWG